MMVTVVMIMGEEAREEEIVVEEAAEVEEIVGMVEEEVAVTVEVGGIETKKDVPTCIAMIRS